MKLSYKVLGFTLAAFVGVASTSFADDGGKGGRKSLESRIAELEAKLKDSGGGGVKGSGIKVSGYVDTSYLVNLSDRSNLTAGAGTGEIGANNVNTGRVFDNQFNSFNLNATKLTIEKDKDSSKFPAGFRVDLMYGSDASVINGSVNNTTAIAATANDNDLAVEQAYVNFGIPLGNGIDVKLGKMVTLIGYEVVESPANWQFSRSDAFRLAPITQAGITLGYKWTDWLTSTVGVVNGYDSGTGAGSTVIGAGNRNTDFSFIGRLDSTLPKNSLGEFNAFVAGMVGNDSVTPATVTGAAGSSASAVGLGSYIFNAGLGWNKPFGIKPLGLGLDYLYRNDDILTSAVASLSSRGVIDANAVSFYHKWDWNKMLTTSGRFSYTSYGNNVTTALGGASPTTASATLAAVGIPATAPVASNIPTSLDVFSYTLTQSFNVWKDTLVRLEWRHDWIDHDHIGFGTAGASATAGRDDIRQEQDTIAVNVVYSF